MVVKLEGCFGQGIKRDAPLGLDFGVGLWKLHTMRSRRLQFLYFTGYLHLAHFFILSTKFGHSIPQPLDLDNHSVKRPLTFAYGIQMRRTLMRWNANSIAHTHRKEKHTSIHTWSNNTFTWCSNRHFKHHPSTLNPPGSIHNTGTLYHSSTNVNNKHFFAERQLEGQLWGIIISSPSTWWKLGSVENVS
jgi:hypothetical protein